MSDPIKGLIFLIILGVVSFYGSLYMSKEKNEKAQQTLERLLKQNHMTYYQYLCLKDGGIYSKKGGLGFCEYPNKVMK